MKTIAQAVILTFVLLLVGVAGAAQLQGAMLLDTGIFPCGIWAPSGWRNDGQTIYLKSTSFWVSGGEDFTVAFQRGETPYHYITPHSGNYSQNYGSDTIVVAPGESLYLWAHCAKGEMGRAGMLATYTFGE